jgi:hypothetical protein
MRSRTAMRAATIVVAVCCTLWAAETTPAKRAMTERGTLPTTLQLLTPRTVRLGAPVEVSLCAKNTGENPVQFIPGQAGSWDDFVVTGPDGKPTPYIGGGVQLCARTSSLAPNATTTLVARLDITDKYLITTPGEYAIHYRGCRPVSGETTGFAPSPTTIVNVQAGDLPAADDIAAHVVALLPKGWYIGKSTRATKEVTPLGRNPSPGAFVYLCDGLKAHIIWLWLTREPASEKLDAQQGAISRYIGQRRNGHLYLDIGDEKAWPDAERALRAALIRTKQ